MSSEVAGYRAQADSIREAFEQKFERFARFLNKEIDGQSVIDVSDFNLSLEEANDELHVLADLRSWFVGRKSQLNALKKLIGGIPSEERRDFAQYLFFTELGGTDKISQAERNLKFYIDNRRLERERVDVTLPGRRPRRGHLHPITQLRQRIEDVFVAMGYAVEDGPEVETDFYNFTALNIPELHPARSPQDTFYTTGGLSLRSQTSTVQIHAMQRRHPPLRVIAPGRVFRRDTPDATHNPMFFQVEGLLVERGVTMGHLKGTLSEFVRRLFGAGTRTRFRPSYFPFTEPSMEADYSCFKCGGAGCRLCKGSGWIELGGSGMVHPNVLRAVDIDPEEFSGFAFGLGIDRMCGLMYELDDIRLLFENDVRFLEQF
jgi:phenylalanyl-tRNA synthetase alpha chain